MSGVDRNNILRRDQRIRKGGVGVRSGSFEMQCFHQCAQDRFRRFRVGLQIADHHFHTDVVMVGMPTVEIGDHAQGAVSDFRFSGQPGLGVIGHADDRTAPAAVKLALRTG